MRGKIHCLGIKTRNLGIESRILCNLHREFISAPEFTVGQGSHVGTSCWSPLNPRINGTDSAAILNAGSPRIGSQNPWICGM